ncbi:sulfatase-like hydrolase/transferase, partial [Candidatus Woesearchaeota archaeon]|nr:sulfatase-like hydrolase/transferase [Candidatus Woesearchaeota archaeon]
IRVPEKFKNKKYSERYDFVVENIDFWLGKVLQEIDLTNTIIILTADHGDYVLSIDDSINKSLQQKFKSKIREKIPNSTYDFLSSKKRQTERKIKLATTKSAIEKRSIDTRTAKDRFLFDDLLHVPFLIAGSGIPSLGVIPNMIRNVDFFPTIFELIDLPTNHAKIDGKSMVPILIGEEIEEEPAYLENTIFATDTESPIPCIGIRTSNYKYFRSLVNASNKIHLYNLKNDFLEENNLAHELPDVVKDMEQTLIKIRNSLKSNFVEPSITEKETKDVEEELKKLGYI